MRPAWAVLRHRALWCLLGWLLPAVALQAEPSSWWALPLPSEQAHVEAAPWQIHVDPGGDQTLDAVERLPDSAWRAADWRQLTPGHSQAAYWLRLSLENPSTQAQRRWLLMQPARLESVRLFQRSAGLALPPLQAGTEQPFGRRPLALRDSAFELDLAPGERRTLWLRVASRSAIAMAPSFWTPQALMRDEQARLWLDALPAGAGLLLILVCGFLWVRARDAAFLFLALFLGCALLYDASMRGTSFMLLWPDQGDWALRALGSLGVLATMFEMLALRRLLQTARLMPRWQRLSDLVLLLDLLALALCVWGDYRMGTRFANLVNGLLILMMGWASWQGWRSRHQMARAWALAAGLGVAGLLPRYLSLAGLAPHSLLADYLPAATGVIACLAVLVAVLLNLLRTRQAHERELERAVQQRTQQLVLASAHAQASDAAKGRLLGYIGHDLRAPLASLVHLTQQLQPGEAFELDRQAIEHSSHLLLDMVDELQRFARQPGASASAEVLRAPVFVHGLLDELFQQTQGLARSGGNQLLLSLSPGLPAVLELDAKRLRQVLFNLLSNAAKFTQGGQIELRARHEGGELVLEVRDNGPGIAAQEQALLFEPFIRGAGSAGLPGLGLGLAIARQSLLDMGGTITLQSAPGEGACFSLRLPAAQARAAEVLWPALRTQPGSADGEGWRALVLDACPVACEALSERLALSGFDCECVPSVEALWPQLDDPSLGLLVYEPAVLDAASLAGLRRRRPDLHLLACSARRSADEPLPVLCKPVPEPSWWAALRPVLADCRERRAVLQASAEISPPVA